MVVRRQCHALNRIILILSVRLSPGNPLHGSIFSLSFFFIYSCLFVCHFHFHQNIALLTRVIPFYFICFVHTFSFLFYFSYTYYSVYYLFLFFLLCSLHPLSWTVLFALFEIVFTMCSHLSLRLSACSVTGSNVCSETKDSQTEDINELWTW